MSRWCLWCRHVNYLSVLGKGIVLDQSEQLRLVKAMGEKNHTLVLKNHGLLTAGPSAAWAFIRHQLFIRNAEIQLKVMASGGEISHIENVMRHTRHINLKVEMHKLVRL